MNNLRKTIQFRGRRNTRREQVRAPKLRAGPKIPTVTWYMGQGRKGSFGCSNSRGPMTALCKFQWNTEKARSQEAENLF